MRLSRFPKLLAGPTNGPLSKRIGGHPLPLSHPSRRVVTLAVLGILLIAPAALAQAPAAPEAPASADVQEVDPGLLAGLFAPDPIEVIVGTVQGPCTLSYQCKPECGGQLISCSGSSVCNMYYGPRFPGCSQNVYVQCDSQPAIYCVGGPL